MLCYMFPSKRAAPAQARSTEPTDPGPETQELLGQTTCSLLQLRCGIIRDREVIETETSSISANMSQRMEDLQCEYGLQLNTKGLLTEGTTSELNDRGLIYTDSKTQVYNISENYLISYFTNQEI